VALIDGAVTVLGSMADHAPVDQQVPDPLARFDLRLPLHATEIPGPRFEALTPRVEASIEPQS
jgi:hypothetical protein